MSCADWQGLGIEDYPMIIDDSENGYFVDWFGPPYPKNVILNKDMEVIHISYDHHYPLIESGILLGISQLTGNENMEPDLNFVHATELMPGTDNSRTNPLMKFDDNGRMHIVWFEGDSTASDIYYIRSDNFGNTFTAPLIMNSIEGSVLNESPDKPVLEINGEKLMILWADTRLGYPAIFMAVSDDSGTTFSEDYLVSNPGWNGRFPETAIAPDGILHLLYYIFEDDELIGTRYARTEPEGVSFISDIDLDLTGGYGMPCPYSAPDMEINNDGDIFIAYRNSIFNERDAFLSKIFYGDTDVYWAGPLFWSGWDTNICLPTGVEIALNHNRIGSTLTVYDPEQAYMVFGLQDNMWFDPPILLDNEQISDWQGSPVIFFEGEYLHAVWIESSAEGQNIYYGFGKTYQPGIFNKQRISDIIDFQPPITRDPAIAVFDQNLYCVYSQLIDGVFNLLITDTVEDALPAGDVNGDEQLNILDIILIISYIIGDEVFSDIQITAADVNDDSTINILDIIQLVNIILAPLAGQDTILQSD